MDVLCVQMATKIPCMKSVQSVASIASFPGKHEMDDTCKGRAPIVFSWPVEFTGNLQQEASLIRRRSLDCRGPLPSIAMLHSCWSPLKFGSCFDGRPLNLCLHSVMECWGSSLVYSVQGRQSAIRTRMHVINNARHVLSMDPHPGRIT